MSRYQNIGRLVLQLLLLTTFNHTAAFPSRAAVTAKTTVKTELPTLPLERQLAWREVETTGPRCFQAHVPTRGNWWIEVRSTQPATHPSLMVLDAGSESPRVLERVEGVLLEICHPGEHRVCLTSATTLGDVELASTFLKGGDPMEIEVGCDDFSKGGDPMEIEVDPNP